MRSPKLDAARSLLAAAQSRGVTWRDYAALTGAGYGAASGMLSRLHSRGEAQRLAEKRDGYAVYVLPEFVGDRATIAAKQRVTRAEVEGVDAAAIRAEVEAEWAARLEEVREQAEHMVRDAQVAVELAEVAEESEVAEAGRAHEEEVEALRAEMAELRAQADEAHSTGLAAGRATGLIEADKAWQSGYDEGAKAGAAEATKDLKRRMTDAGGEPFMKGREVGRREGEEVARRHVAKVAGELFRTISESAPVRTHHNGCYKVHPDCSVKAVALGMGVPVARLKNESAA